MGSGGLRRAAGGTAAPAPHRAAPRSALPPTHLVPKLTALAHLLSHQVPSRNVAEAKGVRHPGSIGALAHALRGARQACNCAGGERGGGGDASPPLALLARRRRRHGAHASTTDDARGPQRRPPSRRAPRSPAAASPEGPRIPTSSASSRWRHIPASAAAGRRAPRRGGWRRRPSLWGRGVPWLLLAWRGLAAAANAGGRCD